MRLVFLGTRANTELRSRRHRRHSALLASSGQGTVMIDCGEDWRGRLMSIRPAAILLTHAHPDHAWGLKEGAACPVYASAATWQALSGLPICERRVLAPRSVVTIESMTFEAFPVEHSLRCPAMGFRIMAEGIAVFYVPDVVAIIDRHAALAGASLYIGDGATLTRPMVRRRGKAVFGHTTVRAQLGWCAKEGVPLAIFTHCGSEIISMDSRALARALRDMASERGLTARVAYDGMNIEPPCN